MLTAHPVTKKSKHFQQFVSLYKSAFPVAEQAPIWLILRRAKKDYIKFDAYYDKEIFAGFTYTVTHKNVTFVLYIAVEATHRSKGYGSQIINRIKEAYPNNRIILYIEAEDESAENNQQRKKRKQFYIKSGFSSAGINLKMMGVVYEMMTWNGQCTAEEFSAVNKKFFGSVLYAFLKPKLL
ncbi:MAG: GNAT family N-acetyltransferase [Defluviitaleaceae bacterium]|nr:GNAT family N-acetyltransferase [Defluviitaleaceae bacterium]